MKMTRSSLAVRLCALLVLLAASVRGDVSQQDTVGPNRFEFTQAEYVVAEDASHAVIWVRFHPGHRGISGGVAYRTEDGTAIADEDYLPVAASLSFSGWANRSFNVPIVWDSLDEGDQTLHLRLLPGWKTEVGPQATATLRITNVRPPLKLALAATGDGTLTISWPDDGVVRLLEKCDIPFGGNWTVVTNAPSTAAGRLSVTETQSSRATFYRLRKPD